MRWVILSVAIIGSVLAVVLLTCYEAKDGVGELIAVPNHVLVNAAIDHPIGSARVTLINKSVRTATIRRIERSCTCVDISDLAGTRLGPGESKDLVVEVEIPKAGIETHRVEVYCDGMAKPVLITIETVGQNRPPCVVRSRPMGARFFDLGSSDAARELIVETCEEIGAKRWLGEMTCEIPEVVVDLVRIEEQQTGSVVIRKYHYRIGWRKLPKGLEFYGNLYLASNYQPPVGAVVGAVAGTTARR